MAHVFQPATTARSKCRGCAERIAAGALRFGETVPNAFAEGDTTHWFHLDCAAYKRPAPFLETLGAAEPIEDSDRLKAEAQLGLAHERVRRVSGAERDPSGRAQCRHCKTAIAKGAWRISLVFYEDERFNPAGFIHPACAAAYLETTDILPRLKRFAPGLTEDDWSQIVAELRG